MFCQEKEKKSGAAAVRPVPRAESSVQTVSFPDPLCPDSLSPKKNPAPQGNGNDP